MLAGMLRDSESGLDATLFRKYASNLARWISPDPVAGNILNPQSLNRYAYVVNNPTNLTDPLGLQGERAGNPNCPGGVFGGGPRGCLQPWQASLARGQFGGGIWGGMGQTCRIDGIDADCGFSLGLERIGVAAQCPNNDCTGIRIGADNVIRRWVPEAAQVTIGGNEYPAGVTGGSWEAIGSANDSWCGLGCMSLLKTASNFSAGAGSAFWISTVVNKATGAQSVVDTNSTAYSVGSAVGATVRDTLITAAVPTAAAAAGGKYGTLFGRGGAFFNRGPARFGWYWTGTRDAIGLRLGAARTGLHIPFWFP